MPYNGMLILAILVGLSVGVAVGYVVKQRLSRKKLESCENLSVRIIDEARRGGDHQEGGIFRQKGFPEKRSSPVRIFRSELSMRRRRRRRPSRKKPSFRPRKTCSKSRPSSRRIPGTGRSNSMPWSEDSGRRRRISNGDPISSPRRNPLSKTGKRRSCKRNPSSMKSMNGSTGCWKSSS